MSFLYPLFLLAGIALAIPVLIHLFNLKRFKTVYFPHVRFLQQISVRSRRSRQLRQRWLLLTRMLFLLFLILAFARPFTGSRDASESGRLQLIYLDNSFSMSESAGSGNLFERAVAAADKQIRQAPAGSRFLLLTNDKPLHYSPVPAAEALQLLQQAGLSGAPGSFSRVLDAAGQLLRYEAAPEADLYYYSDFRKSSFPGPVPDSLPASIRISGIPVRGTAPGNLSVDSAWISESSPGGTQQLIVRTIRYGEPATEAPIVKLMVDGQMKNMFTPDFSGGNIRTDTLDFHSAAAGWQQIEITVNDGNMPFDDSFRISFNRPDAAPVLILNQDGPNPWLQAAFRSFEGFSLTQAAAGPDPGDLSAYRLIYLNHITSLDSALAVKLSGCLQRGQTIVLFPGRTTDPAGLNEGLSRIGDISLAGIDTARSAVSDLQRGDGLIKDIFDHIPDNVRLPLTNWHYRLRAGLTANQQAVMSFRNGDPFLARYTPSRGHLYIASGPADLTAGNFPSSYFFAPLLYRMAAHAGTGSAYALTLGSRQPVYMPLAQNRERRMIRLSGNGTDAIPPQHTSAGGLEIHPDQLITQPGFYTLHSGEQPELIIGVNASREESDPEAWELKDLRASFGAISWTDISAGEVSGQTRFNEGFPLWKVCITLALLMLLCETIALTISRRQTFATQ